MRSLLRRYKDSVKRKKMSDSEDSIASRHGSEKSATRDETTIEATPTRQNCNGDKPEEFEKLLQSMIVCHSPSEEGEQAEEEEDNAGGRRIIGRLSYSLRLHSVKTPSFVLSAGISQRHDYVIKCFNFC